MEGAKFVEQIPIIPVMNTSKSKFLQASESNKTLKNITNCCNNFNPQVVNYMNESKTPSAKDMKNFEYSYRKVNQVPVKLLQMK